MSETQLRTWLSSHDLEVLADTFIAQDITLDILDALSEADLRELGLSLGMRRRLRKALGAGAVPAQPAPPEVERLPEAADPGAPPESSHGERRRITVVFVDLVGSTALSASLDPEELREHINNFQQQVSAAVTRHGGFVARFMGDGLLAYFGYPTAHEDDAERAVLAGLAAIAATARLTTPQGPAAARVGIASGLVVIGEVISAGETRERSAVGETPNLAARLQGVAEPGQVVVAASTRRLAADAFTWRALGARVLKGFDEPVQAFVVEATHFERSRFDARGSAALIPLLGRDMEISLLRERWDLACLGEGQAVLLVGEAGIGKSRITHSLVETVRADANRCLLYQCSPLHLDSPLWPVLEQIRGALSLDELSDPTARRLRAAEALARAGAMGADDIELICEALGLPQVAGAVGLDLSAQQKRQKVLQALQSQALALSRERALLVVLEDVHWVDPSTREMIDALLQGIGDARVMLLMTSRPEGAPALAEHAHVTSLTLNRLSRQATREIVRAIAREHALSPELVGGIVSRTDGVPLFVEELTKAVLEAAAAKRGDGMERDEQFAAATIPETLHDSLMARLDRVPALKGVAQIAACVGRTFDFDLLEAVCDLPREQLVDSLDGLVRAGLVFCSGTPPVASYSFKHALVRDAAYESMLNAQRRAVHGRIADALETHRGGAAPELVAVHATSAGDTERAFAALLDAGERSARTFANSEAVSHYRQALDLLASLPESPARQERELDVLQALGVPLIAVRGYASTEVENLFERACRLCDVLGIDDGRRFMVLRGLWNCLYDQAQMVRSTELAEELVALAGRHDDPVERALAYRALGSTLYVQGDLAGGERCFRRLLDEPGGWSTPGSRAEHGEAPEIVALQYMGWVAVMRGRPDEGLALCEDALAKARETAMPIAIAFALAINEIIHWLRGDAAACARTAAETRLVTEQNALPFWRAHSDVFAGWATSQTAPGAEALALTRAGLDAWVRTGARLHVPTWSCVLVQVALATDDTQEARAVVSQAREAAEHTGERFMLPELLRLSASIEQLDGDAVEARALLKTALSMSAEHGSHWLGLQIASDLARCLTDGGELSTAIGCLDDALARITAGEGCRPRIEAEAWREALRARLARGEG